MTETTVPDPAAADTRAATDSATSPGAVRDWLVDRIAYYLECAPADIDAGAELAELGLDSVYALSLCGDVEDRFGLVVEPTMAWDHPSVDALTTHLVAELVR
ncbi:acyl carrier protein [Streptomyces sp. NPDC003660]